MSAEPFRCVVVGEETLLAECAKLLLARGHSIEAVVSPEPRLLSWAAEEDLPTIALGDDLAARLEPLSFDYLFSVGNLRMLPEEVLALPKRLPVNFHDGPLPRHAGLFATSWAILDGDKQHGVTWHVMNAEADTGDVLKQRAVPVDPAATVRELDVACFDAGVDSFGELVDELAAGTATRTPQDLSLRSYHGRWDGLPRAGLVDWSRPAAEVDALVRATSFGPRRNDLGTPLVAYGATMAAVGAVEPVDGSSGAEPGTVVDVDDRTLTVATGEGDVRLLELTDLAGRPLPPATVADVVARAHDGRFPHVAEADVVALVETARAAHRRERRWLPVLGSLEPLLPPRFGALGSVSGGGGAVPLPTPLAGAGERPEHVALAAALSFLTRLARGGEQDVALAVPVPAVLPGLFSPLAPLRLPADALDHSLPALATAVTAAVDAVRARTPYRRDLALRNRTSSGDELPVAVVLPGSEPPDSGLPDSSPAAAVALTVRVDAAGTTTFEPGGELTEQQTAWLAEHFTHFLDAAAVAPHQRAADLPLLTSEERVLVTERWNDTAEEYPRSTTVSRLVAELASAAPDNVAVRFAGRALRYEELDQRADQLARRLASLGAGPGTLVGVCLSRSPELLTGLLAVLKSGAAYVPIDPIYPLERIGHMLRDSGAQLVVTDEALAGLLEEFPVTPVLVEADPAGAAEEAQPYDRSDPDGPAYVIYTSGSTGLPKGVQVGNRALVNFLWTMARRPGFGSADSLLALTTVCFDIAGLELYLPLVRGGSVEILTDEVAADGVALRARVESSAPTVVQATPTTWQMLLAAGWEGDRGLRALCGGERLPAALAERLVDRVGALYNVYGPTETTIWSTTARVRPGEPVTIGTPIGNTRCHVLDERGQPVPPGIPGELYLSGDGVADGYLNRPKLTAERFADAPDGSGRGYRTGDLVRYLPDGQLEYLERIDGQIKLNGYRIELGEVETVLRAQPGVTAAAALLREDRPGERRLVGYVAGGQDVPKPAGLRTALADRLPGYMVPSAVLVLPALPLTPNGKIDRAALPRPNEATGAVPVRTALERRVAEVWCEVLGLEQVGAEDNFFDAGGDSLALTSVAVLLRERLDRPVTRLDMFGHPSVRAMAEHLAAEDPTALSPRRRRTRDTGALAERRGRRRRRS